jgi:SH3-like domain-containing protein
VRLVFENGETELICLIKTQVTSNPSRLVVPSSSACVSTVSNTLVALLSKPDMFSRQIAKVRPGDYNSLDYKIISFHGLQDRGWFQIELEGRKGWISDDTFAIERKNSKCPS